jgi:transposase|tara:strand:+ start:105 stop:344 length:240 start_codon:yes stop_codon:yes gene_type:complete
VIRLVMRHAREPGLIAESKNSKPECCPLCGGTSRVIADVTDPEAIQIILAHLKQRTPPDVVRRQRPEQCPQNNLCAAIR